MLHEHEPGVPLGFPRARSPFFALEGLSLLCPPKANFTPERCALLLEEADDHEERGPAIESLYQEVRRRAGAASGHGR